MRTKAKNLGSEGEVSLLFARGDVREKRHLLASKRNLQGASDFGLIERISKARMGSKKETDVESS